MANGKDPAFLFYSKDFYEGTRTMLPTERACYIDLMIYQHQHGFIPNDLERVSMYCNGCSQETVKAVLEAKFKLCLEGWYNETMKKVIDERSDFSKHQSINGTVGQFFKKAHIILNKADYKQLREYLSDRSNKDIFSFIEGKEINEAMLQAMLIALHKHLEDEDANEDVSLKEKEEEYPFEQFWNDYDKKVGDKGKIEKKWNGISASDRRLIKIHIPKYKNSRPDKQYRKDPATYLNNHSWLDEIIEPNKQPTQQHNDEPRPKYYKPLN